MTMNKQEQWGEEWIAFFEVYNKEYKNGFYERDDFQRFYLAACKKRDEEQRLKNEKALAVLKSLEMHCECHYLVEEYETIKSALESV